MDPMGYIFQLKHQTSHSTTPRKCSCHLRPRGAKRLGDSLDLSVVFVEFQPRIPLSTRFPGTKWNQYVYNNMYIYILYVYIAIYYIYTIWFGGQTPRAVPLNFGWDISPLGCKELHYSGQIHSYFFRCMFVCKVSSNSSYSFVGLYCGIGVTSITTLRSKKTCGIWPYGGFRGFPFQYLSMGNPQLVFMANPSQKNGFSLGGSPMTNTPRCLRQIRLTRKSELQLGIAPKGGAWHPKALCWDRLIVPSGEVKIAIENDHL